MNLFFSYIDGVTFKLISSSRLVKISAVIFHLGIASHLPYIWKSMDVWLICAIIQSSLPSLTLASPLHPLTFLPSRLLTLLFCLPLRQPHLSLGLIFFALILT